MIVNSPRGSSISIILEEEDDEPCIFNKPSKPLTSVSITERPFISGFNTSLTPPILLLLMVEINESFEAFFDLKVIVSFSIL